MNDIVKGDMVYTLKPVKVHLDGDDCNIFDAYLVGYGSLGFCEQNSGVSSIRILPRPKPCA